MRSNLRITWRRISSAGLLLCAFSAIGMQPVRAQSQDAQKQDIQQLKDKLQQLDQMMNEVRGEIHALEAQQQPPGAPHVVNTVYTTGTQATASQAQPEVPTLAKAMPSAPQPQSSGTVDGKAASASRLGDASPPAAEPKGSAVLAKPQDAPPQPEPPEEKAEKPEMEVYGKAQLDIGYDFNQINPNWFDVVRPTQLPSFTNEFGHNGNNFTSVRQSRLGVKNLFPTPLGQLKTVFEFELFGVGIDAGQTTFRLRHAYGELGQFLAGQTWSPFMDPDVFPNSIEYWGPNGMVFFRNLQFRWQPIHNGNKQVMIAVERPGASADLGSIAGRNIIQGVKSRFPAPDVSGHVRYGGERTYIQVAGIFRYIAWDDNAPTAMKDISGHTYGWGVNASSNVGVGAKDTIKMSFVYGHGVENYMNDAPVDVAPKVTNNIHTPITGDALPVLGVVAFYDHYWNDKFSSTIGYSMVNISNAALQTPDAFHRGHYALTDLLYNPAKNVTLGGEYIYGRRSNFSDGFGVNDNRIQFSFIYNFSYKLLGAQQ
jgi:DcaP outer membrane protein